jgi:ABC-type oligopeptide transport system substrate-binding subunit
MGLIELKLIRTMLILTLLAVFTLLAACGSSNDSKETSSASPSAQASPSAAENGGEVTITKEKYDKIKNGMTYKEIIEIVGGEGELVSESGKEGDDLYATVVMYQGKTGNASLVFLKDELQTKSQFGLE